MLVVEDIGFLYTNSYFFHCTYGIGCLQYEIIRLTYLCHLLTIIPKTFYIIGCEDILLPFILLYTLYKEETHFIFYLDLVSIEKKKRLIGSLMKIPTFYAIICFLSFLFFLYTIPYSFASFLHFLLLFLNGKRRVLMSHY